MVYMSDTKIFLKLLPFQTPTSPLLFHRAVDPSASVACLRLQFLLIVPSPSRYVTIGLESWPGILEYISAIVYIAPVPLVSHGLRRVCKHKENNFVTSLAAACWWQRHAGGRFVVLRRLGYTMARGSSVGSFAGRLPS